MYIDNLLSGAADMERAFNLQDTIISVFSQAGFDIRKWTSSDAALVEKLPAKYRERANEMTIKSEDYSIKTLGVKWSPNPDHFSFVAKLDERSPRPNEKHCQKSPDFLTH